MSFDLNLHQTTHFILI